MEKYPPDVKTLTLPELEELADDIRQRILEVSLKNGGHLGASLGTVELALALHATFDSPREPIIWDVGHQAYAHKLITGRWESFATLRQDGGISGFLSRKESEHDVFGAGHSSTSLSAALGLAWAARAREPDRTPWTIAVIGDGGLTAGLAFEALANVSELELGPLLIVLNDNQMSISANSGAIPRILSGGEASTFFGFFGVDYLGPVDGHNLGALIDELQALKAGAPARPIVLHALTQKGKGYSPAEELPSAYHGVSPVIEKTPGQAPAPKKQTYGEAATAALCRLAERDPKIVAITAAMREGTSLVEFERRFPDRFFDVGIAEGHAVAFAAGLAARGFKPVVCIYSTFLQRAYDQIIHDAALQELGVTFLIDRAGIVGADGPTHHGAFDLAYLAPVPGIEVYAPACLGDLAPLLERALAGRGHPIAIRYPRGSGADQLDPPLGPDGLRWHREPAQPSLIAVALGTPARRLLDAAAAFPEAAVVSCVSAKPIPAGLIAYLAAHAEIPLLTVEEGAIRGGFGEALLAGLPRQAEARILGYGDHFIAHGSPARLEDLEGLSRAGIEAALGSLLRSRGRAPLGGAEK